MGFMRRKQYKKAAQAYSQALKSDPRNATLYRNRAAAFACLGLWDDCVKDTETVVSLMPNNRKAMLRHKAVCDYMDNYNVSKGAGYDRQSSHTDRSIRSKVLRAWRTSNRA